MNDEPPLENPTINFDHNQSPELVESIFTIEEDFDPNKACHKLVERDNESDKYITLGKIAQGGMGEIHRVFNRDLKRMSVIKIILPHIMANRQMFINFIQEARITGQLEHPNIIPVHDLGVIQDDKLFFSMKEIEGEALNTILNKVRQGEDDYMKKYALYPLLTFFRKVCDAMAFAHSRDIIHRDIKPENIMVGNYGEVLLVDWGLARRLDEPEPELDPTIREDVDPLADTVNDRKATRYGDIKGTPAYMPPEMARGEADEIDKRSDIFLLGATLYAIATLTAPFLGDDIVDIINAAESGDFDHPQVRAPYRELPTELCRIILKSMAADPDERYQCVEDLNEDLDDLLGGRTASEQKIFHAGELLMREGDTGREGYVIITGEVQVYKTIDGKEINLITLGPGDSIGEMAMISDAPRSASVMAMSETHVVVITEDLVKQGLEKLPPWMGNVVEALVERLRATNRNVHPLLNNNCSYHVLNQLAMIYIFWGRPQNDEFAGQVAVSLDYEKAVKEVATNLCIGQDRVADVIANQMEWGLITDSAGGITIPNFMLFLRFVTYLKLQYEVDSDYREVPTIHMFQNPNEFVVRHQLNLEDDEPAELELIESRSSDELLGCSTEDQIADRFLEILQSLQDIPIKPA